MKTVVKTPPVEVALRTLDAANQRRVHSWFDQLANWDNDAHVRNRSQSLDAVPGAYVLNTTTDLRIFFRIDGNTVTILDIAKEQSILTSGRIPEAG